MVMEEDGKTLWCGNLSEQASEELLYELFQQAGPLEKVRIARDRDGRQKNFAFITFCHDVSVPYAINLFKGTALFHRTLSLQCRNQTATLPPPIRCTSLDQTIEFPTQADIQQRFAEMTENFNFNFPPTNDPMERLNIASLQGNFSHRQHPYRQNDRDQRHRARGDGNSHLRSEYHHHGNAKYNPWETRRDGRDRYNNYGGNSNRRNNYSRND